MNAPPMPFVPEEHQGRPGMAMIVVGFGDSSEHGSLVKDIREALPPLFEFASPMPFTALQQLVDEANAWGFHYYDKFAYVDDLSDDVIGVIAEHLPRKASPLSVLLLYRLDGAYAEVGEDATAFSGGRTPRYAAFTIAVCPVPELLDADRTWVRGMVDALAPYAAPGAYVNALDDSTEDRVRSAYGPEKYARLAAIKAKYDPQNVFHRNANIKPG
jgi:FAD/FMN-containing dehydrogenase